ncbi:hypothetical protein C8R31_106129 [Nitrosospira sp. Nsp2]|uniref:hypothetical protein n=1 Tax=Nitrosospira sp. Nsp2 TaxID=136548 RepID=UPI000D308617|nr:hypothetical protein [Nitrosospira sp. Nsp2]PTR14456.1 hypothetical protein C8R31_106129 [Nitrosospira sp. Nsp2]
MANPAEFMRGAAAFMSAVQAAENINDVPTTDAERADDGERYYGDRDQIKALFVKSMGDLTEFQCGFVATVAEYFHMVISSGHPNFSVWVPDTMMNASEIKSYRGEMLRTMREDEAEVMGWNAENCGEVA